MDTELVEKILKIGITVLDELILHKDDVIVSMTKSEIFSDKMITVNVHPTAHISNDEINEFEKHRND